MNNSLIRLLFFFVLSGYIFTAKNLKAIVPYYFFPETKNLKKESISIG